MQVGKASAECGKRELSVCFIGQFGCIKCDYWENQNAAELPYFYYGRSIANHLNKLAMPVKLAKMTTRKFAAFAFHLRLLVKDMHRCVEREISLPMRCILS